MTTTYLACAAWDQIDAAQAVLDAHPATVDGTCLRCDTDAGCGRGDALRTFARYGRLPQRRPGASSPDVIGRATGAFGWFTSVEKGGSMFRKSSYSGDTNCVEVDSDTPGVVHVRDGKVPGGSVLVFTRDEWRAFTEGVKAHEFDA